MKDLTHIVRMALAIALLPTAFNVAAAETEHREHGPHEHGHGKLSIVADGAELVIELEVPGVNVVGFEHAPSTEEQKRTIETAIAVFRRADLIFVPSAAAKCRARKAEVSMASMEHHADEENAQDDSSGQNHEEGATHSELHAEYRFHCKVPAELESLEVRLYEHLTNMHDVDVQVVTPTLQTAQELTIDDPTVRLMAD